MRGFFNVVFVKQFVSRKLNRFLVNVSDVGTVFKNRLAPTVHVHDNLYFRMQFYILVIFDHPLGKAMNDKNFRS